MAGKKKGDPRSDTVGARRYRARTDLEKARSVVSSTKWKIENSEAVRSYRYVYNRSTPGVLSRLMSAARGRAKEAGLVFTVLASELAIPEICPLLGIPIVTGVGKQGPNSPSLDRIDNTKGYVSGNVWVISQKANRIKSDATADEIILLGTRLKGFTS
jgi:hypothetical protein